MDAMATMDGWVAAQMASWRDVPLPPSALEVRLRELAAASDAICLLRISDGSVEIDPTLLSERPQFSDAGHPMGTRALAYRALIQDALHAFAGSGTALLAIHLDDLFSTHPSLPVFCFQKHRGTRGLLLPDIDFVNSNYYARADNYFTDMVPYDAKLQQAMFVGSTTGSLPLTSDHVRNRTNDRIKSGVFFRGHPNVTFNLPNIVQVDGPETRKLIEALDIGGPSLSWSEQYQCRFIISLDGNGATCSRVALALRSHSVLMKYDSPHQLHYFDGLLPWQHYIPILADEDVLAALSDELAKNLYSRIAMESKVFSRKYLSRLSLLWYTARLIDAYVSALGTGSSADRRANQLPVKIDSFARMQDHSLRWANPHGWLGGQNSSNGIEGFALVTPVEIDSADIRYCGILRDGVETSWMSDRGFCGAPNCAEVLHGAVVELRGVSGGRFELSYGAAYANGFISPEVASGTRLHRNAPLVGLRFGLRPKNR